MIQSVAAGSVAVAGDGRALICFRLPTKRVVTLKFAGADTDTDGVKIVIVIVVVAVVGFFGYQKLNSKSSQAVAVDTVTQLLGPAESPSNISCTKSSVQTPPQAGGQFWDCSYEAQVSGKHESVCVLTGAKNVPSGVGGISHKPCDAVFTIQETQTTPS